MMPGTEPVSVALDDDAQSALDEYVAAKEAEDAAKERKAKAHDALVAFLATDDVEDRCVDGTVDGRVVVKLLRFVQSDLDRKRLKADNPYLYQQYSYLRPVTQVRVAR